MWIMESRNLAHRLTMKSLLSLYLLLMGLQMGVSAWTGSRPGGAKNNSTFTLLIEIKKT